ncbi:flagellar assembly protein FliW [Solibacillus silvestris]|nr:flagellar assembly protein FliW [Solibacillus silvestris]OBW58798.1 flagellar assembly protein FliW [Solibacillus silvestris]
MKIQTAYMDDIAINEADIIHFQHGLPGFEEEQQFILLSISNDSIYQVLQSIITKEIAFIVASPFITIKDYNFELDEATVESLQINDEREVAVLGIVTLKESLASSTINLKAPIVLNTTNKQAKQVILDNSKFTIHQPLSNPKEAG